MRARDPARPGAAAPRGGGRRRAVTLALGAVVVLAAAAPRPGARAALPPRAGGRLRLPTTGPLPDASPATARTPLEVAVASAALPRLYRPGPDGAPVPEVATDLPRAAHGAIAIPLRQDPESPNAIRAGAWGRALDAAGRDPARRWLLTGFRAENPGTDREGRAHLVFVPTGGTRPDDDAARALAFRLAAHRLALPVGPGAFRARRRGGVLRLDASDAHGAGAPWLDRVEVRRPPTRAAALRGFELRRLDASWDGAALYGDDPGFATRAIELPPRAAVLLLRNRARLGDEAWCGVAASLERSRLAPAGLAPDARLAFGDEAAPVGPDCGGSAAPRPPATLRLRVRRGDRWDARMAEALAGTLDGAGTRVVVAPAADPDDGADWDARLLTITPTLPSLGALVGEALVAVGRTERAAELVRAGGLRDAAVARRFARGLDTLSLGRRRDRLTIRADVGEVPLEPTGVPRLADLAYRRAAPRLPTP